MTLQDFFDTTRGSLATCRWAGRSGGLMECEGYYNQNAPELLEKRIMIDWDKEQKLTKLHLREEDEDAPDNPANDIIQPYPFLTATIRPARWSAYPRPME